MEETLLLKRLKGLLWHLADIAVVAIVNWIAANLGLFNLPPFVVVIIGEMLAQATKMWNNYHKAKSLATE